MDSPSFYSAYTSALGEYPRLRLSSLPAIGLRIGILPLPPFLHTL